MAKKRIQNRIGDIYYVTLEDGARIYLQYVAIDTEQLYSPVIRVFKRKYLPYEEASLEEVVCGEVLFYAHTSLRIATREGWWKKVGSSKNLGNLDDIKFRLYSEGNTNHLTVSHKWYVWTINQKYIHIGDLVGEYKTYSMGFVYPPYAVYQKIITGKYPFHELK